MNKTPTSPAFLTAISFDNGTSSSDTDLTLDGIGVAAIAVFALFGILTSISTVYHLYLIASKKDVSQSAVTAFSLCANAKKLLTVNRFDKFPCLHGIKAVCMFLAVFSHSGLVYSFVPVDNMPEFVQIVLSAYFQPLLQLIELTVDTFLAVGGFLVGQAILSLLAKREKVGVLSLCLHRWLRMTPILSVVLLGYCGLLRYLGAGPLWRNIDPLLVQSCRRYWWSVLLHAQNYLNPQDICIVPTWYVAVDMQLMIVASLVIVPLHRKPFLIYSILSLLSVLSVSVGFFVIWSFGFQGTLVENFINNTLGNYFTYCYFTTHTRMAPYLLGVMLGYTMHNLRSSKRPIQINSATLVSAWTLTAVLLIVCLNGNYLVQFFPNRILANAVYSSLVRPTWAALTCWLIFACITDHAGSIATFLSLPGFQILSKLSYSLCLVHIGIIYATALVTVTEPLHYDFFLAVIDGFWYYGVSLVGALVTTLLFEMPLFEMQNLLRKNYRPEQERKMQ